MKKFTYLILQDIRLTRLRKRRLIGINRYSRKRTNRKERYKERRK